MRIKYKAPLLLSVFFIISACASHNEPPVNIPNQWYSRDINTRVQPTSKNTNTWWKKFNDSTLNTLIEKALANNNDLAIATGNILEARASLQKAQYSWLPTLALAGTGFTGKFSDINVDIPNIPQLPISTANLNPSAKFNGYAAGLVPSYSLNILQQIQQGKLARANLALQIAGKNAVRLEVTSQIANGYFTLLGLKKQLMLQNKMIHDAKSLRYYTKLQYQQGSTSNVNTAALDQFIALLEKKNPEIIHNMTQLQNALRVLINDNPGPIITHNTFDRIRTDGIIPINLPSETLRIRPDIAMAEYQLQASNAMVGIAISELFPSFSLTGLGGLASMELGKFLSLGNTIGIGQVIAGIPIVKMSVYADIAKSKGQRYKALHFYLKTIREALADVDNALSKHETTNNTYKQQFIALTKANEQYHLLHSQYKEGAIAYSETIMAQLNVDYMQANLNQVKMQQINSIVNVYQAFGG